MDGVGRSTSDAQQLARPERAVAEARDQHLRQARPHAGTVITAARLARLTFPRAHDTRPASRGTARSASSPIGCPRVASRHFVAADPDPDGCSKRSAKRSGVSGAAARIFALRDDGDPDRRGSGWRGAPLRPGERPAGRRTATGSRTGPADRSGGRPLGVRELDRVGRASGDESAVGAPRRSPAVTWGVLLARGGLPHAFLGGDRNLRRILALTAALANVDVIAKSWAASCARIVEAGDDEKRCRLGHDRNDGRPAGARWRKDEPEASPTRRSSTKA